MATDRPRNPRRSRRGHRSESGPIDPLVAADPEPDQYEVARTILLRQLTMAPRSKAQLATKLAEKNVPEDVAAEVLDRFEEVHLINDELFARSWVESRHRSKGLARASLARELRAKGIDAEDIDLALEEIDDDDERQRGRELVERKMARSSVPEDRAERDKLVRRLVGMLARKGYRPGLAFDIVKEVLRTDLTDQE